MDFRQRIKDILTRVIPFRNAILLDYPYHYNIGDCAIYLGELYAMKDIGVKVGYIASKDSASFKWIDGLIRRDNRTAILLHGGGNFGDLWKAHHIFRLKVISQFKDVPITQLPQTIYFEDEKLLEKTRKAIAEHSNFTLLVRDHRSFDFAAKEFDCEVILCPDMAFYIDPRVFNIRVQPRKKCLFLKRKDKESRADVGNLSSDRIEVCDWVRVENDLLFKALAIPEELGRYAPNRFAYFNPVLKFSSFWFVFHLVKKGLEQLSGYEYIITDRLHGHILSLLLGKKHFLIEQKTSKLRDYYETWSKNLQIARFISKEELLSENFCDNLHI